MQLLRTAIVWAWLAAAGPNSLHSFATGHQVQVKIPVWDVGGLISQVSGYMKGQDNGRPPKKKERPHSEEYWPPYGYYDPALMYPPYYYPYPPYPPPTNPPYPPPTNPPRPTKGPTRKTTKKPKPPTTKKPPVTTTEKPSETTTEVTTTGAASTTTEGNTESTTTEGTTESTTTEGTTESTTTEGTTESTTTEGTTESTTTEGTTESTTTEGTTESTTTEGTDDTTTASPPGRDLCQIYAYLPECQNIKSVHLTNKKYSSSVLHPDQKLSIKTEPHSVSSLCFYYPRLCMKPEEAQFVSLSDENGKPLLLISPVDKKSLHSKGKPILKGS